MFCEWIRGDLSRMLDGESLSIDRDLITRHLNLCSPCCEYMGLTNQVMQSRGGALETGQETLRRLEGIPEKRPRWPRLSRRAAAGIAATILLASGLMGWGVAGSGPPAPPSIVDSPQTPEDALPSELDPLPVVGVSMPRTLAGIWVRPEVVTLMCLPLLKD